MFYFYIFVGYISTDYSTKSLFMQCAPGGKVNTVTYYGCVTNNNGFWIEWLDLLTMSLQSLLITINYSTIANLAN
jgi:hypothetical protein